MEQSLFWKKIYHIYSIYGPSENNWRAREQVCQYITERGNYCNRSIGRAVGITGEGDSEAMKAGIGSVGNI